MSATVRSLCVNNSHPTAGAVLARLAKDRRPRMGPPSAPLAVVAGDGVQGSVTDCYRFPRFRPLLQ